MPYHHKNQKTDPMEFSYKIGHTTESQSCHATNMASPALLHVPLPQFEHTKHTIDSNTTQCVHLKLKL